MCRVAVEIKDRKGLVIGCTHRQCTMELYAIVTFTGGFQSGRTSIYYCPRCGKIQGGTQTPEQLFNEWEGKGIKFEVEYFY